MHKVMSLKQKFLGIEKLSFYILTGLLVLLTALGLSVIFLCMYYSKPIGDDFGAIQYYHSVSWLPHALDSLATTGRYGQSIASAIIYGLFGTHTSVFLSLITLSWIVLLVFAYLKKGAKSLRVKTSSLHILGISLTVAFLILFINKTIDNGNPPTWVTYQLFFWPSGTITYVIPFLILFTVVYFLEIGFSSPTRKRLVFLAIATYITGLFNEIQPSTLVAICVALLILSLIPYFSGLRKIKPFLYTSGVASVGALLTSFFSAGSRNRQATLSTQVEHGHLAQNVFHNLEAALKNVYFRPRDILLCFAVGFIISAIIAKYKSFRILPLMLLSAISLTIWLGSLLCSFILVGYGYGDTVGITPRTLLFPQISYLLTMISGGIVISILASRVKKYHLITVLSLAISVGLLFSLPRYVEKMTTQLNSSLSYSNLWTYEDQYLRERALKDPSDIIYLPPSAAGIGDGFNLRCNGPYSSSTIWLNDLIEKYYNLREVCSTQDKSPN